MRPVGPERILYYVTWTLISLGVVAFLLEITIVPTFSLPLNHLVLHSYLLLLSIACPVVMYINAKIAKTKQIAHLATLTELQQEISKTAWRYKCLLEGAGNPIYVFNADSGILEDVNRLGMELLGYSREEMQQLHGLELVKAGEQERFASLVLKVKRRGRGRSPGIAFVRKDGQTRIVEIDARLIVLEDEKVVHVIVRDVTSKHQAQHEIRRRNHELTILNRILAQANENLQLHNLLEITLKEVGEFIAAEGAMLHLLADHEQELQMSTALNISHDLAEAMKTICFKPEAACRMAIDSSCHAVSLPESGCCGIAAAVRSSDWKGWLAVPLWANSRLLGVMHLFSRNETNPSEEDLAFFSTLGRQIGIVIGQNRFFAELNWKNEELRRSYSLLEKNSRELELSQSQLRNNLQVVEQANQELARLDRMKGQFLGMISHEFRTPLTSILGSVELLRFSESPMEDDERLTLLEMIHKGGVRLNDIFNNLIKVANIEAKNIPFSRMALNLDNIIAEILRNLQPLLEKRRQTLLIYNVDSIPTINADREFITSIFSEMLQNAIKFTPDEGEILIAASVTDSHGIVGKKETIERFNAEFYNQMGFNQYLMAEISDNGIGIDTAEHHLIFEKFYELGDICNHYTSNYKFKGKGAGLGLAIVKGMVEAHGGMVWVESRTDGPQQQGSSFFLLLPIGEHGEEPRRQYITAELSRPDHEESCR